jgi:hypothetical protein
MFGSTFSKGGINTKLPLRKVVPKIQNIWLHLFQRWNKYKTTFEKGSAKNTKCLAPPFPKVD